MSIFFYLTKFQENYSFLAPAEKVYKNLSAKFKVSGGSPSRLFTIFAIDVMHPRKRFFRQKNAATARNPIDICSTSSTICHCATHKEHRNCVGFDVAFRTARTFLLQRFLRHCYACYLRNLGFNRTFDDGLGIVAHHTVRKHTLRNLGLYFRKRYNSNLMKGTA